MTVIGVRGPTRIWRWHCPGCEVDWEASEGDGCWCCGLRGAEGSLADRYRPDILTRIGIHDTID